MKKSEKIITVLLLPIIVISLFMGNNLISSVKTKTQTRIEQKNNVYKEQAGAKAVYWSDEISGSSIWDNTVNDKTYGEYFSKSLKGYLKDKLDITNVTKIIFNDISKTDKTYTGESIDISKNKDNSVHAIVSGETLYIQYKGTLFLNENSGCLFAFLNITSIEGLEYISTSNVTNVESMFYECSSLISLDLSNFNISNVENMDCMFSGCSSLTNLNLSNFNTSNVKYMGAMFYECSSLISLDLSNFNTSNVVDMQSMFSGDEKLEKIYVSALWVVADYADDMFYGCTSLIGGNGTKYNEGNFDKDYAVIDTKEHSGYLTSAAANLNPSDDKDNTSSSEEVVNPETGNIKLIIAFIIVVSSILLVLNIKKKLED